MPNVFISHRCADGAESELLAKEVQKAGHQVWLDEWEITVGDSIVHKINEGLQGATYLVLCYSSDDVLAPWISREWMSALSRQLSDHAVKILPVRLTGGEPPAILADIKFADLVQNWQKGIADLLRAIK